MTPPLSAREAAAQRQQAAAQADPTLRCTDLFAEVMQTLLGCANQALIDCGRPVGRAFLAPGSQVAWDDCCDGQLWVRMINVFPSGRPFPAVDSVQPCGIAVLAVQLAVGVVRCAAVVDDNGNAPTPEELTADTLAQSADASILLSAIQCCDLPTTTDKLIRVGTWTPSGPQGGCVGGEWTLTLGVGNCGCGN